MKNEAILQLAEEILIDLSNYSIPLGGSLLKCSRLSLMLELPDNVKLFKEWAKNTDVQEFRRDSFYATIDATQDPNVSVSSANPQQYTFTPAGNWGERKNITEAAKNAVVNIAHYRASAYEYVSGIATKWKFGSVAQNIFERKRLRIEPKLRDLFPDVEERLNSIEQNILSENSEDWKNAVVSCRTLLMDLADVLNPPIDASDKGKYINRLKNVVSPKLVGQTKTSLLQNLLEETKNRIEHTSNLTQGAAHKDRPAKDHAEDVVLYTYLLVGELIEAYSLTKKDDEAKADQPIE